MLFHETAHKTRKITETNSTVLSLNTWRSVGTQDDGDKLGRSGLACASFMKRHIKHARSRRVTRPFCPW